MDPGAATLVASRHDARVTQPEADWAVRQKKDTSKLATLSYIGTIGACLTSNQAITT